MHFDYNGPRMHFVHTRSGIGPALVPEARRPVLSLTYYAPVPEWVRERDNDPRPVRRCGWVAYRRACAARQS